MKLLLLCLCRVRTRWACHRCLWGEGRQGEGWGGRVDRKKGRQAGKEEEGKEKKPCVRKRAPAELGYSISYFCLIAGGGHFDTSRPGLQRRQSTKGQTSSFLLMSHSKCQTTQSSLNFTWMWALCTKSSFRFLGQRNKLIYVLDPLLQLFLCLVLFPQFLTHLPPSCHLGFRSKVIS